MAVAVTPVGNPTVFGNKHVRIVDLVFSGNYQDTGESLTAADLGFPNAVEFVQFDGAVIASDTATALVPKYDYATETVICYESAATGLAVLEKTDNEAYPTGATVRVLALGH